MCAAPNLESMPAEISLLIWVNIHRSDRQCFIQASPTAHRHYYNLVQEESSSQSTANKKYACFTCLAMLDEWKFSDKQLSGGRTRSGEKMGLRFCIRCGLDSVGGYCKGRVFYIRQQTFVLCKKCGILGKTREMPSKVCAICECCADGTESPSYETALAKAWAVAESPEPGTVVGRYARWYQKKEERRLDCVLVMNQERQQETVKIRPNVRLAWYQG